MQAETDAVTAKGSQLWTGVGPLDPEAARELTQRGLQPWGVLVQIEQDHPDALPMRRGGEALDQRACELPGGALGVRLQRFPALQLASPEPAQEHAVVAERPRRAGDAIPGDRIG